jgi:UrcA family protein
MQRLTGAFVSTLILVSPALAVAQDAPQQAVEVNFGDLNMTTDGGATRALHRIRRAAEDVCDASTGRRTYEDRIATRACVRDAMSRAVDELDSPTVAAKFNGNRQYARSGERS